MIFKNPDHLKFLIDKIQEESIDSLHIISSDNLSELTKTIEKTKVKNLYISPQIDDTKTQPANLFVILKDIKITEENLGRIKNVLSQKIIIFSNEKHTLSDETFFKLGFINEFNDKKRKIKCFSYNLKTYNNKRDWNNPEGWANPENFDKFRW